MLHGAGDAGGGGDGPVDRTRYPYRMKDLCEKTGLPRQVVHFYIQQGLVPEGFKTSRNMGWYGDEHVERIRLVRQLQHERFLPLKAIRAMLEQRDEVFSPAQRVLLGDVKTLLRGRSVVPSGDRPDTVTVEELCARAGVTARDFDDLLALGLFAVSTTGGREVIARDDAWIVEFWGEMQSLGFTRERGFSPADIAIYDDAITRLFDRQARVLAGRIAQMPVPDAARMLEHALPMVGTLLARLHLAKARNFFAAMG